MFNALMLTSLNEFPVCATKLKGYFVTSVWLTNNHPQANFLTKSLIH